jgi:hypothetical protein
LGPNAVAAAASSTVWRQVSHEQTHFDRRDLGFDCDIRHHAVPFKVLALLRREGLDAARDEHATRGARAGVVHKERAQARTFEEVIRGVGGRLDDADVDGAASPGNRVDRHPFTETIRHDDLAEVLIVGGERGAREHVSGAFVQDAVNRVLADDLDDAATFSGCRR